MKGHSQPSISGNCCSASQCEGCGVSGIGRREFMAGLGGIATASAVLPSRNASASNAVWESEFGHRIDPIRYPLVVQPVFVYGIQKRREGTSWRHWGGIHTERDAAEERIRISSELEGLAQQSDFPIEILPLESVQEVESAQKVAHGKHDVLIMYPAGGWVDTLEALTNPEKFTLMFLRHRSGPAYLWYEIVSNRFLRKTVDDFGQPGIDTRDVVVDRTEELLWRLRSLSGLKNSLGKKIVCIGGAAGWGQGGRTAPENTQKLFGMDLVDVSYEELGGRLKSAWEQRGLVASSKDQAGKYLSQENVTLETSRDFVEKGFLLTEVFHQIMKEYGTDAITINQCMGTIMEVSETTACLPLSLLNDAGYLAFCESDFVVIPSGVLLHYISGKPVFFQDPTYPHDGIVTLAHCTAPRKMDGEFLEPARVLTHFESDWGAAPKVEMKVGQEVTVVDPDFNFERWMGFRAEIIDNPFLDICRSQIDVAYTCDTDRLNEETRGFHWMLSYGDYLKEMEYAVRKNDIGWLTLA
jgi:hypothetical protein